MVGVLRLRALTFVLAPGLLRSHRKQVGSQVSTLTAHSPQDTARQPPLEARHRPHRIRGGPPTPPDVRRRCRFYNSYSCIHLLVALLNTPGTIRHADRELLLSSGAMYVIDGTAGGTANDGTVPPL